MNQTFTLCAGLGALILLLLTTSCSSFKNLPPKTLSQLLETISVTKKSPANISLAYQACDLWGTLLEDDNFRNVTTEIRTMCQVLYASCLVRTGRDDQAVTLYAEALNGRDVMSKENMEEAILGLGRGLQRLLQYDRAREQFLELEDSETAVCSAATCALRLGDPYDASRILQRYLESKKGANEDAEAMLFIINILSSRDFDVAKITEGAESRFLCRWLWCLFDRESFLASQTIPVGKVELLDLITTNLSPFDDHNLIHLDDKVLLHALMQSANTITQQMWPFGVTHPMEEMEFLTAEDLWIHKRRSGYGSHGNTVLTMEQARELAPSLNGESLLQRMVRPLLLIDNRKFSLRIYVVHLASQTDFPEVYISRQGLLKLASVPITFTDSHVNVRVHMTNSGRESNMIQHDLDYLKNLFEASGWSFDSLWKRIVQVVQSTMELYNSRVVLRNTNPSKQKLSLVEAGVPKVLGFDFVVDQDHKPWLIEINRFPGLEARDRSDRVVKEEVLLHAWDLASRRYNLSKEEHNAVFGGELLGQLYGGGEGSNWSCLEPIYFSPLKTRD